MVTVTTQPVRTPDRVAPRTAPLARPGRAVSPGRVRGGTTSCQVSAPAPAATQESLVLKLKLGAVAVLTVAGSIMAVGGFMEQAQPDPLVDVVAGDPGWAHVSTQG